MPDFEAERREDAARLAIIRGALQAARFRPRRVHQVGLYLGHVGFDWSISRVGRVAARDRATIRYACRRTEDARDEARFDQALDVMERALVIFAGAFLCSCQGDAR